MSFLQNGPQAVAAAENERRFRLFAVSVLGFLLVSPFLLRQFDLFTVQTYVLAGFVWLHVVGEIFSPGERGVTWWRWVRWLQRLGWLVVGWILFQRIVAIV
ncbi:hypothetical protein [Haloarcula sebkhae]|uniref:Uncharacterized protein n=2 Tax=Haloarcula sebkhae TaxID=932660 RepID=A0A830EZN0_9EURY|nr:hypothetical protein [Haloarcula sebkhae]GGK72765.1 hypothetical protein GCM10009067_26290 [Haloarcula sebkhae]